MLHYAQMLVPFVLFAGALWARTYTSAADRMSVKLFDFYQRQHPMPSDDVGVRFVDIDDETLAKCGQWPWPRTLVAKLIDRLVDSGAQAIALDMVFPEPDRLSPARLAASLTGPSNLESLRRQLVRLPDNDSILARAVAKGPVVLGAAMTADPNSRRFAPKVAVRGALSGAASFPDVPEFPGAVTNLPILEKAASGEASIAFLPESDGIIRREPMLQQEGGMYVPSLGLDALRVAVGAPEIHYRLASGWFGSNRRLESVELGDYEIPVDPKGRLWTYFSKDGLPTIPAWRVLDASFDKTLTAHTIVFVGTSAMGLKDMRANPMDPSAPGVVVHATAVEDIVSGRMLSRPLWADAAEILAMLVLGLLVVLVIPYLGAAVAGLITLAGVVALFGLSWYAFSRRLILLDPVFPGLTISCAYFASAIVGYLKSEAERREVKGAMSRYMAPALVEQLAKHPERLRLGGELREMTFHFCDIRGFTTISEQFDPHGLTVFINRFLTPMTDIILAHQGVIDKYMGDCIMAFWNAPLDDAEHARHACQAALAMHERLGRLNADLEAEAKAAGRKFIPIHIGTGLNTGRCVVGNMGSDQRFDYSVLGDDVNLASRLEGQSKSYGVGIIIGPRTREQAPEFAALELDLIKVKGKTVPVHIFALLGGPELARRADFQAQVLVHGRMLEAYRARRWDEAASLIRECRGGPVSLEKLYALYDDRIAAHRQAPPPADWDGAFAATSK